jgi:hypothetical protein
VFWGKWTSAVTFHTIISFDLSSPSTLRGAASKLQSSASH